MRHSPIAALRGLLVLAVIGGLLTAPAATAVASGTTASPSPVGVEQVLFRGGTAGYGCFRIPALVRTPSGAMLAFAEGRTSPSCADRGDIDIVMRRSTNDGRTWGPIRVVLSGSPTDPAAPFTRGNPAPVVDLTTGLVLLLSTSNAVTPGGQRLPWVQRSDDDGLSWSAAQPIGASFDGTHDGWFATGPSHGIQLRRGAYPNRLVVGAHQNVGGKVYAGVLYSDNHGDSWQASSAADSYVAGALNPGEVSVAELVDGTVYAAARNAIDQGDHRAYAISPDGGMTMPKFADVPSLVSPDVQGAVLDLKSTYQSVAGDTLLYSGPSDPNSRKVLQLRYSTDGGRTWTRAPGGQLTDQRAGYSDLAELAGGEIGTLYEGGVDYSADELRFNRISPAALGLPGTKIGRISQQQAPQPGPTTPDATLEANDAYLAGDAVVPGSGQGLVLDGMGDYADLPYARSLDPGSGDFTFSLRFKHIAGGTSPQRALLWGYGVGTAVPQLWVRLQPSQDQVYAWVQGAQGGVAVAVKDLSAAVAFGDGAWHHLSLVRRGSQVTVTVDGLSSTTETGVAGPVTGEEPIGLRLGGKPDATSSDSFNGSVNEFRLYRRALSTAELDQVRLSDGLSSDAALSARLPFSIVDTATAPSRVTVAISDDLSGHCAAATLLGGWRALADGRISGTKALPVDTAHPGAQVPFTQAVDLGSGDFTVAAWFRYSATATPTNQVLVWAFGATAGKRSLWVRAQPSQDRLYAWVQTDTGQVAVTLPDLSDGVAFGDDAWHLLALTRAGGQVQVSVDGGIPATGSGLTGSVTADKADGILGLQLGSKPDGTDVLQGALDDFRLYRRALSGAELASAAAGSFPPDVPSVWWSFDSQYTAAHEVVRPTADNGLATPDSSVHCRNAYVRGSAVLTGGKSGSALAFDGVDDAVQLSYGAPLALGEADFTITTWLKYSSSSSSRDQVIVWAYGVGPTERTLWLRAQPGKDRLYALVQTETGTSGVAAVDGSAATAFGDNAWHHVALKRAGGVLSLIVDGVSLGSTSLSGSLTYGDAFAVDGFQLGARLDGVDRLSGALDEFQVFSRALTATELNEVRNNADLGAVTAVRLSFDVVSAADYARM
jgi:sialidase-1